MTYAWYKIVENYLVYIDIWLWANERALLPNRGLAMDSTFIDS